VQTIHLQSRLPTLLDESGPTTIDGYSQPGSAPNTDPLVSNAQIRIEIKGNGAEAFDALYITTVGNVVRGLSLHDLRRSVWLFGPGASGNIIAGNFIGTNAVGTFGFSTTAEVPAHGVHVENGARGNRIGGVTPAERNVISGNGRHGVGFWHVGTNENVVVNNLVGLSPDGTRRLANRTDGVDFNYGASYNLVGGVNAGERNVISGNNESGVEISHGSNTIANTIRGNYIGTDVTGSVAPGHLYNGGAGVWVKDRVRDNLVADNVVGNSLSGGILVDNYGNCCATGNRIENNRVGIGVDGRPIPNLFFGIRVNALQSRIGPGNIIANNPVGIQVDGDGNYGNTITQNSIYGNAGLGIDLAPLGQFNPNDLNDADTGPNLQLNFPVLTMAVPALATGTACIGCRVEIFVADAHQLVHGEGKTFAGAGVVDSSGLFTVSLQGPKVGDFVTATATDQDGNTSEFALNILVTDPANLPPTAVNDTASTVENKQVTIDVLFNDSDPNGDELFLLAVGPATEGQVTVHQGLVSYLPNPGFIGTDSFIYFVTDNIGGTSTAVVTVEVKQAAAGSGQVTVSPVQLNAAEGGAPVTYTLTLASAPTAPVAITVVGDDQVTVDHTTLTFDAINWNIPQTVSVTAVADTVSEGPHQSMILHNARSDDSLYNNIFVQEVAVAITERHAALLPFVLR
jgi:hypothetical protein